jgi:hypothetical protein
MPQAKLRERSGPVLAMASARASAAFPKPHVVGDVIHGLDVDHAIESVRDVVTTFAARRLDPNRFRDFFETAAASGRQFGLEGAVDAAYARGR